MMHVSIGRICLKPGANRLWFLWYGTFAFIQANLADGIVHASTYREDGHTFWSLSVWKTPDAMAAYRDTGSHLRAMKVSREMGASVDFIHWISDAVPTWESARERLIDQVDRKVAAEHFDDLSPNATNI